MKRKTSIDTTLATTATVLGTLPVFAHSGHSQKTEAETKIEEKSNHHHEQSASPQSQATPTETQVQEEQPPTQTQTITITKIPTLGESLLGLIIVTPLLLYALKKRIHR